MPMESFPALSGMVLAAKSVKTPRLPCTAGTQPDARTAHATQRLAGRAKTRQNHRTMIAKITVCNLHIRPDWFM